jgi:hypothetical protein
MALRKSKIEILDRIITKAELSDDYYWSYWYDDDWDDHDGYCDCYSCMPIYYGYLPDELQPKSIDYVSKRVRITYHSISPGKMIDMTSIYSKEVLRQKRINHILGIESMEHSPTTLGDILNIKK